MPIIRGAFSLLTWIAAIAVLTSGARAENFSVDISAMAEIDEARPLPDYKIDRTLTRTSAPEEKAYEVSIRFRDFGDVPLAYAYEEGSPPLTYGLNGVKVGWIRNSTDLFIVGWLIEPHPSAHGTGREYLHEYTLLRLKDRQAQIVLKGASTVSVPIRGGVQTDALSYSRFSFDAGKGLLEERLTRNYEQSFGERHDLAKKRDDIEAYIATINETVVIRYRVDGVKLTAAEATLVYLSQKEDPLVEIARFYLGPLAPARALLDANPALRAKAKDPESAETITLDKGVEVRIPVPQEWLIAHYGR